MHTEGREHTRDPSQPLPADVAALPQRARTLWAQMLAVCDSHLQSHIHAVLDTACDELFRLADQSINNAEQQSMLASKREIQRAHARLAPRVLSAIGQPSTPARERRHAQAESGVDGFNTLELVDPEQFEESVLLDDITARLNSRSAMPLFELGYRVAALQATPMLNADELPFGPRAVVHAFRDATADLDLPTRDRQLLLRMLERQMGPVLRTLYEDINTQLVSQRILPNLHAGTVRRAEAAPVRAEQDATVGHDLHPSSTAAATAEQQPHADAGQQDEPPAGETPPTASPAHDDADYTAVFSELCEMLARHRGATSSAPAPASTTASRVPEPRLLDALKDLQLRTPPMRVVNGRPVPRSMKELRQELMQRLQEDGGADGPLRLSPPQQDTLDLVSMLFEGVGGQLQTGGATQTLLTRLQVPMLRAAMTDHGFFSQHEHPARRLLDSLIETANQWLDQGEPDPALSKHLRALTHRVANEYDGDNALFDEARRDIDEYVGALVQRSKMAEKRHVEAARGRERLEVARSRARELIDERVADGTAPELVNTLLQQVWTDVLSLTILRSGERSDAFRRRMRVTDQLLRFTTHDSSDRERSELRTEIASGLGQVGIQGEEATQLARRVAPDASSEDDAANDSSHDGELTHWLRQRHAGARSCAQSLSRSPGTAPLDKDGQVALDRILQLPFGSILLALQPDKRALRRKLAWYSPRTGRCLMLNQRGSRCGETMINDLARAVASGRVRLPGDDRHESMLDRAWRGILDTLRQFGSQTDDVTTPGAP